MKAYIATGILGLAAISAYFIFTADNKTLSNAPGFESPVISQADVKAQVFEAQPARTVEASEAEIGLAKLGLLETSEDITWDNWTGDSGNYVFTNLIYTDDDITMKAAHFELSGVRLVEDEQVYFDTLNAEQITSENKGDVATIGAFGIKLPETTMVVEGLPMSIDEEEVSIIDFVTSAMEPGVLTNYPEVFVENLKVIEKDEVWDASKSENIYEDTNRGGNRKEVINTTRLDFASVTKDKGQGRYKLQLDNFVRDDHTYYWAKQKAELRTLSISGFDPEFLIKLEERFDGLGLHGNAGTMFEPLFLSLDLQGFKIESEADIFRVDQAMVRHSDTRGNQFTRRIDVPQIYVAKKAQPASKQDNERATYSPVHMMLDQWGYDDVNISISSQTSYDKINKSVSEDSGRLSIADAMEFNLSYKVNNISNFADIFMGRFNEDKDRKEDLPSIEYGQFSVTDHGLGDRMFAQMAEEQGLTVEESKQAVKGSSLIVKTMAKSDYQKEQAQNLIDAYSAFIDDGGKFQISMRPQRPIYFTEFFGLGESIEEASMAEYEEESSESEDPSSEDFETSDEFTDDVTQALQNDAMDNLLREMNISFEHYIAD